ncbi:hypothetical protein NS355_03360 [Sphingomonas yabuuchiae]|uniref:Uncharacterized protein n=1 Tax=Sphingomonas yabuuchiae TaxID=172044 RepID=A0A147IYK2_9SPHN|nr:hypothetical protein [Sphingomonas yabuuchiae]KTW00672.1 hypothetical protein NS355_03360 [Sphingomonas yabuuchiae]
MPIRSASQRIGRTGKRGVESLIDGHPRWVARRQNSDFVIDLKAELANLGLEGQVLRRQLIKL